MNRLFHWHASLGLSVCAFLYCPLPVFGMQEFEQETLRLLAEIGEPNETVDAKVLYRFAEIGPEARAAAPLLKELIVSGNHTWPASRALASIGAEVAFDIRSLLRHDDAKVRTAMLSHIGSMRDDAATVCSWPNGRKPWQKEQS